MIVAVPGADIHYTARGSGPTCLVPSSIGTGPYARQLAAPLDQQLRVVIVDPRGGGRSTGQASELTFDVLAADLEAVRRELGVARVAVLGHSIFGMVAVEYARRCPDSVSHVVLVGTPPTGDMAALAAASKAYFEAHASDERKRVMVENAAALPAGATPGQQLLALTPMRFFDPRANGAAVFDGAEIRPELIPHVMTRLAPGWDIRAAAGELRAPVLVALGRHDYVVPHTLWDGVAVALPRTTVRIFEQSGHQPFFEEPAAFAAEVSAWMSTA